MCLKTTPLTIQIYRSCYYIAHVIAAVEYIPGLVWKGKFYHHTPVPRTILDQDPHLSESITVLCLGSPCGRPCVEYKEG